MDNSHGPAPYAPHNHGPFPYAPAPYSEPPPRGLVIGGAVCSIVFWSLFAIGGIAAIVIADHLAREIGVNGGEVAAVQIAGGIFVALAAFAIVAASLSIGGRPGWSITTSVLTGVLALLALLGASESAGTGDAAAYGLAAFGLLGAILAGAGTGQARRFLHWKHSRGMPTAAVRR
jgi:hypothetical protein